MSPQLPLAFTQNIRSVPGHIEWMGVISPRGVPVFMNSKGRWENAAALAYRQVGQLGPRRQLVRTCGNPLCVRPQCHLPLDALAPATLVELVLREKVEKFTSGDAAEHWMWKRGRGRKPQVTVDGKTYGAVSWAHRLLYPERHRSDKRLDNLCDLRGCVNPACWDYGDTKVRLWRKRDLGYETPCRIGMKRPNNSGYVRLGNRYLHRVIYERETGRPLARSTQLHHLCGQRTCCEVTHLVPVSRAEHDGLHGKGQGRRA